jgi:hypothetical protein
LLAAFVLVENNKRAGYLLIVFFGGYVKIKTPAETRVFI